MAAPSALHVVEGGDHSLAVLKRGPASQQASDDAALVAVANFVQGLAP